jgi:hypothetical protein
VREPAQPRPANGDAHAAPRTERSRREQEREEAYARNPDQPIVRKPGAKSTHAHPSRGHQRPVPALLMKRRVTEPESA